MVLFLGVTYILFLHTVSIFLLFNFSSYLKKSYFFIQKCFGEQILLVLYHVTNCELNASVKLLRNFDIFFRVKECKEAVGLVR